jgi:hypothetical protein
LVIWPDGLESGVDVLIMERFWWPGQVAWLGQPSAWFEVKS